MRACYRQDITCNSRITSRSLVNASSTKVVNIRSTKMMKTFRALGFAFASPCPKRRVHGIVRKIFPHHPFAAGSRIAWSPTVRGMTTATGTRRDLIVMVGLVPAIHVFTSTHAQRRECPGHLARRRASRFCPGMTPSLIADGAKVTPDWRLPCRALLARRRGARSARGRVSTRRSRARSGGRT